MADRTAGEKKRVVEKEKNSRGSLYSIRSIRAQTWKVSWPFDYNTKSKIVSNDGHYSRGGEGKFSRGKNRLDGAFLPPSKGQTRRCSEPTSGNALKLSDGGN